MVDTNRQIHTPRLPDSVEFFIDIPEGWSKALNERTQHSHDRNASIDRTIDVDLIRNREKRNRSDIMISIDFFQIVMALRKFGPGGKEHSVNEIRGNNFDAQ